MATINGTIDSDRNLLALIGTALADTIRGRRGSDQLYGGGGNDLLYGDQDNDELYAAEGDDLLFGGAGDDTVMGDAGNDILNGDSGDDLLDGGDGDDKLFGGSGDDDLAGGEGNDYLGGGSGADWIDGGAGNDIASGGAGRDYITGGDGNDLAEGGSGHDVIEAGKGNDVLRGGSGADVLIGGDGEDLIAGGAHNDYAGGGDGNDVMNGDSGKDMLEGGAGDDAVNGGSGNDGILDGDGDDVVDGGSGNDSLASTAGNDLLRGGSGNDALVSYADAGEPEIAQDANAEKVNADEPLANSSDVFNGGSGADTFFFHPVLDARDDIIAKYTDAVTGWVDWEGVAGENGAAHNHWVESFGDDTIVGFRKGQGDKIVIDGHTVSVAVDQVDVNGDGKRDYSLVTVTSDQGGAGAHDGDLLGTIKVYGDAVTAEDISTDAGVHFGVDTFAGRIPVYGSLGENEIADGRGSQTLYGSDSHDHLTAYGDGGEPVPTQSAAGKVYDYEPAAESDDLLIGGRGADSFEFRPLLNGKESILAKHVDSDGHIDWEGVAGENGNVHDHWVEGIGNDIILDFSKAEGDVIVIEGHTVEITVEQYDWESQGDNDADPDYSVIYLHSNQGGAGAHNQDLLGTITVYGDLITEEDVCVDAGVHYGIDMLEGLYV